MTLQTNLDFVAGRAGLEQMRRLVAQLNAAKKGVKFVLVEAQAPFIVCSVEAILAGFRRIPNTEVAETMGRAPCAAAERSGDARGHGERGQEG